MFRITRFMQELIAPTPLGPRRDPPGPVVIWNLVRRCNLTCRHCYSISGDVDFPGELSTAQVCAVMQDLRSFGVPVLILSGGEPLLRHDIFAVSRQAASILEWPRIDAIFAARSSATQHISFDET